jgi:hypothetical protein
VFSSNTKAKKQEKKEETLYTVETIHSKDKKKSTVVQ